MVRELPAGDVTVLFTDIEGSTRLWEERAALMPQVVARHGAVLRSVIEHHGGVVVKDTGDGVFAVFDLPSAGVLAAVEAQAAVGAEPWPVEAGLRVRMGLHRGDITPDGADYHGPLINRAARIMSAAWGGQIVVSDAVKEALDDNAVPTADLGLHRLKDLAEPLRLHQVLSPGLAASFPPLRTLEGTPNNLPAATGELLGRQDDIAAALDALSEARIVTLTGAGGSGKTRLALQVAADALDTHPGGAWFVDLASLVSSRDVPDAVRSALRFPPRPGVPWADELADHFDGRAALLVLDNCEHLIDDVAQYVETAVRAATGVRVLATSREALHVAGEVVRAVPPLALPDGDDAAAVSASPAVRLFLERARALSSGTVDDEALGRVASICRRLDGIPLAIELAAARASTLSVELIAERLDDRFRLLTGGARTAMPRQRTLEAAVEWSYDLLEERDQAGFAALTVFAGRFDLPAAGAVLAALEMDDVDALDLLDRLVNRSLLVSTDADFAMLETIRAYGRGRLAQMKEADPVRAAHAAWVRQLAAEAFAHLDRSERHHEYTARLSAAIDDVRSAVAWSRESGHVGDALMTAALLYRYWGSQRLREGQELLDELMEEAESAGVDPAVLQMGALALAGLVDIRGEFARALELSARALDSALSGSGLMPPYIVRYIHGRSLPGIGDWDGCRRNYELMAEEAHAAGEPLMEAIAHMYLAALAVFDDDLERADHFVAREAACLGSDPPAMMLSHLAEQVTTLCVLRGDLEAAQYNAITSLEAIGTVGHRVCISHAIETASMVVLASGRPVDAAVLFEAASAIRHDFGSPPLWFECLLYDRARDGIDAAVSPAERALARERAAALVDDAAALELAMSTLRAG